MLDPWIIEEILKKEEERRREQERGRSSFQSNAIAQIWARSRRSHPHGMSPSVV